MGSSIASVGNGLIQGFQLAEGIRRGRVQDERLAAQDERAAAQEGRRAEMDGLTIQNQKSAAAEYDANAPVRAGALSEKLGAQKEAAETKAHEQELFAADKHYQETGDLSGYKNTFRDQDPNYEVHSIAADPKSGQITVEVVDHMAGTITPKVFKNYDDLTNTLAKFSSPSARQAAVAAAKAQQAKIDDEARKVDGQVKVAKVGADATVEAARIHGQTAARTGSAGQKQQEFDLFRRIYPKEKYSDEQIGDMIRQSKSKSPEDRRLTMATAILNKGLAEDMAGALEQVDAALSVDDEGGAHHPAAGGLTPSAPLRTTPVPDAFPAGAGVRLPPPPGARQIGTSGGVPVYEDSTGKRFTIGGK